MLTAPISMIAVVIITQMSDIELRSRMAPFDGGAMVVPWALPTSIILEAVATLTMPMISILMAEMSMTTIFLAWVLMVTGIPAIHVHATRHH